MSGWARLEYNGGAEWLEASLRCSPHLRLLRSDPALGWASISVAQLEEMAPSLRAAVVSSMGPMSDADLGIHFAQTTDDEVRKGCLEGPYDAPSAISYEVGGFAARDLLLSRVIR
eukprot:6466375-Amphidinium_carterae.3